MLDIYVGNLPERANAAELRELYIGVTGQKLRDSLLDSVVDKFRNDTRADEQAFTLVEHAQGRYRRYCLISGHSRAAAISIINQFSDVDLHGHVLEVRPFYQRKRTNDQRRAGWRFRRWLGVEHRTADRRDNS